jgi:hypothetical protein
VGVAQPVPLFRPATLNEIRFKLHWSPEQKIGSGRVRGAG